MNNNDDIFAQLHRLLEGCLDQLDRATDLLIQSELEPLKANVQSLGDAAAAVLFVRSQLYASVPELQPAEID